MTIEKDVKRRKISRVLEDIKYLEHIKERPIGEFLKNYESILATRHAILECVQACLDFAFHVCAWNKLPAPASYKEVFTILAEHDLLDRELASKMENWVGLRNLIMHTYEKIDDRLLHEIVKRDLDNFTTFIKAVEKLVEK
jgi:uncharacterized protein YutE (UPF0331/DUF86 family)